MDALLMCGGRGTRLDAPVEKPLLEIGGVPMVDRVAGALAEGPVGETYAVVSPNAPETRAHLDGTLPLVETPGDGYVEDLGVALEAVERPVVTVAADLPLLTGTLLGRVVDEGEGSRTVVVPSALKAALGVDTEHDREWVPSGVNVVGRGSDTLVRSWDARLAVNVNRNADAAAAERLLVDDEP